MSVYKLMHVVLGHHLCHRTLFSLISPIKLNFTDFINLNRRTIAEKSYPEQELTIPFPCVSDGVDQVVCSRGARGYQR